MAPDSTAGPVLGSAVADDDVLAVLRGWLPAQRWYPVKGSGGDLARVAVVPLVDPLGEAVVGLHLFGLPAGGVLQVPVVLRAADAERPTGPAHVGTVARPGGALVVLDGCQDPAFLRAWLAAAHHDVPVPDVDLAAPGAVRGLGGEQSNTSVLLPTLPTPAILKVFRAVSPGANPDVEVPLALHHAGWGGVPRPLAWLEGRWPDAREPDGLRAGTSACSASWCWARRTASSSRAASPRSTPTWATSPSTSAAPRPRCTRRCGPRSRCRTPTSPPMPRPSSRCCAAGRPRPRPSPRCSPSGQRGSRPC